MAMTLQDTAITKAAKECVKASKRLELIDDACPGLRIRLTKSGVKTWVLACRDRFGAMRRFPIGSYPHIGISVAREKARELHHKVKFEGADPIADRRRDRAIGAAAKLGKGTLRALLDLYGEKVGKKTRTWDTKRKSIEHVFRDAIDRPLATLKLGDLQMIVDAHPSAATADSALKRLRPALRWAGAPGRAYVLPEMANLIGPKVNGPRKRTLDREELAALLPVLRASNRPFAAALRFMLLTMARRDEVCEARWRDMNLTTGVWTVPITKTTEADDPIKSPLSRQAVELLRSIRPENPNPEDRVFCTRSGGKLAAFDLETKAIQEASGTSRWHRHDLRRTGATMLGEMGELPDIVEAALNHTNIHSQLAATYNRSRYRPMVAIALQRLADALDGIERGGAEIVPMKRPG